MGIKQLNKLIAAVGEVRKWSDFKGAVVAIDTMIYLYRFQGLKGLDGEKAKMQILIGFVNQISFLTKMGIVPFYIFDGKPPEEKKAVLEERKERRLDALTKMRRLEDALKRNLKINTVIHHSDGTVERKPASPQDIKEELDKLRRASLKVKVDDITLLKQLLNFMGVPYYDAPGEAEWFCAKLNAAGVVDACLSEDTDLMPNGAIVWLKDYKPFGEEITVHRQDRVLNYLKMNFNEFVDMCIIMGCDNLPKIPFVGPDKASKLINKFKDIESILGHFVAKNNVRNYPLEMRGNWNYKRARELFAQPIEASMLAETRSVCQMKQPMKDELLSFFDLQCEIYDCKQVRVRERLIAYCDGFEGSFPKVGLRDFGESVSEIDVDTDGDGGDAASDAE